MVTPVIVVLDEARASGKKNGSDIGCRSPGCGSISFCSVAITTRPKLVGSFVGQSVAGVFFTYETLWEMWATRRGAFGLPNQTRIKHGSCLEVSMPTIAECLENARQCEWYAARTNDEEDRKFLLRKAKDWTKQAIKKELEIRAAARVAA
jgi:hypothetical protein